MRAANWKDYELIDTGSGERLERWGDILLTRPDPQIILKSEKKDPRWRSAHARYKRSSTGGGKWEVYKKLPDVWKITRGDLTFRLKPMGFKHTGVFPEQAVNWDYTAARIRAAKEKYGIAPEHMALVGDQIYTDVLGANCGGITSILVRAIHNHNFWLRLRHVAELPFIAIGKMRIQHEKP